MDSSSCCQLSLALNASNVWSKEKVGARSFFFYWMTVVDSMRFDEIRPTASKGDMLCFPTSPHPSASTWNRH